LRPREIKKEDRMKSSRCPEIFELGFLAPFAITETRPNFLVNNTRMRSDSPKSLRRRTIPSVRIDLSRLDIINRIKTGLSKKPDTLNN